MFERLKNVRNRFDFFVRSRFTWSRDLPESSPIPPHEFSFQQEIREFFELLRISDHLGMKKEKWVVSDVGTKNFSVAPVMDELFLQENQSVEIHGIEIDAYRRLSNFRTRADYARFFAKKARDAFFHAINFLDFQKECDWVFLLNPFVSEGPTLAWGLPLSTLQPEALFSHAYQLLRPRKGILVLSNPSEDEFEIASELAKKVGFRLGPPLTWRPQTGSAQKKPRWGRLCFTINR